MKTLTVLYIIFYSSSLFSQQKEMSILHWNDFHARNTAYTVTRKDSTGESRTYYVGGTASMLGYLNKYRDHKSLVLNGGDDYQGSPISSITKGRSQIELLNLFSLDAFVLGNHEFDYGSYTLDSSLMSAKFPYLSANVWSSSKNRLIGQPHIIKDVDGIKTGIIGITALDLETLVMPSMISDVIMLNTDSVITENIKQLKEQNVDVIILLTHVGIENDKALAEKFYKDVDIIVGGHSHTPLFRGVNQNGVLITQSGSYGRYLGVTDLIVDTEKDTVISFKERLVETILDSAIMDRKADVIVNDMLAAIRPELERVIGVLKTDWKRSYSSESNIGQWQADVIRAKMNADAAFLNSGGIRKDLPAGNITVGDIWEINPFGNTIVTFDVKGSTLRKMIANNLMIRMKELEQGNADMIVISGLKVEYSSAKITGGDIVYISSIMINGAPLEDNKTYTITSNNYVAAQFKKYFGEVDETIVVRDSNMLDRDIFIEAVSNQREINQPLETRFIEIK